MYIFSMSLQIHITLTNKWLYFVVFLLLSVIVSVVGIATYTSPVPSPGHGGDGVLIRIDGVEMTLQEAIDTDLIGKDEEFVFTGEYVGDGTVNRIISVPGLEGRTPKMVWVAYTTGYGMPVYRIGDGVLHSECSDSTERWCTHTTSNNLLGVAGGFTVSTGPISTNANGYRLEYTVWV